ncbi:MAG: TolC family protein [Paludibacteraceae bacterium]|jgi:outer membrane protein TolC|nr:TolC family protein [Paludibacteraceae bacterium]
MKKSWLIGIFSLVFAVSYAQQDSVKLSLSLEEAKQYALENNRTLQNATLEVRQAHAARWQTIASMLPQADMSLGLNYTDGTMKFALQEGMPPMERNIENLAGSLSISASMAINGQLIVGALLNNLAIEMQNINHKSTELDVILNVENLYITALAMNKTISLLDSTLLNLEKLYEITKNVVEAGVAEQTQADQIQVQVSSMRSAINSTKRSVELIYNSLALQLACGAEVELELTDNLDDLVNVEAALQLLGQDFDINNNYSYQLASKNVELAKKNVIMAGMAYVPTLSAFYQYTTPNKYFSGDAAMEQSMGVVGLSLSIPLWSSGKRAAAITEKRIAKQVAENQLADARDGLYVQHKQLRYNLSSAYEDFDTQKMNIDVSQRVFNSVANKFEYGYASSMELTNASTTFLTAQSDYIKSILNLVEAQINLKKLLNK